MTTSDGPRVPLYERQVLVRQGLRCLLEHLGFQVVAESADGCDLIRALHTCPDVVVVGGSCDKADFAKLLRICLSTKAVVLVDDAVKRAEVARLGCATVSKDADATTLSSVVWRVCGETKWCPPESHLESLLNARDREVLRLLATGRTNKEIGTALGVTEKTVRQRLTNIFASIGVRNRTEAALYALGHCNARAEVTPQKSAEVRLSACSP